jgi:hypothetical protein
MKRGKPRIAKPIIPLHLNSSSRSDDASRENISNIARGKEDFKSFSSSTNIHEYDSIPIDAESAHLLDWLAREQGISQEAALKKAIVLAAYLQDLTLVQGEKLLVQRRDNSLGEIILK